MEGLAIDLEKGTWYDHENQAGGGVLALIAAAFVQLKSRV
jgi:hypothetical protein